MIGVLLCWSHCSPVFTKYFTTLDLKTSSFPGHLECQESLEEAGKVRRKSFYAKRQSFKPTSTRKVSRSVTGLTKVVSFSGKNFCTMVTSFSSQIKLVWSWVRCPPFFPLLKIFTVLLSKDCNYKKVKLSNTHSVF